MKIKRAVFDWKRTLYDLESGELIRGTLELLNFLRIEKVPMILIGKGGEDMQAEVERLGVLVFFENTLFAEGKKDPEVFKKYLTPDPKETLFIGDRVRSELEIGNKLGATTIWIKQGKFSEELPENELQKPTYTTVSLPACLELIKGSLN